MDPGLRNVILFYLLVSTQGNQVGCVVSSEWSLAGPTDEYTMAIINVTYTNPLSGQRRVPHFVGEVRRRCSIALPL